MRFVILVLLAFLSPAVLLAKMSAAQLEAREAAAAIPASEIRSACFDGNDPIICAEYGHRAINGIGMERNIADGAKAAFFGCNNSIGWACQDVAELVRA